MRALSLVVLCLCLVLPSCAKTPASLGPAGITDFQTLQIGHDLDLIRDIAQEASKTSPPVLSRDIAVKVTLWHKAAVQTLASRPQGWKATIQTGLDGVLSTLTEKDRAVLLPYVTLLRTVLASL
jgi:hypothetical protein